MLVAATTGVVTVNGIIAGAIAGAHIEVQFMGRAPGGKGMDAAIAGAGMAELTCRWLKAVLPAAKFGAAPVLLIAAAAAAAAAAGGAAAAAAACAAEALAVDAAHVETAAFEIRDILVQSTSHSYPGM